MDAIEHKIVRFQLSLRSFFPFFLLLCLSPTTKNPRSNGFAKMPLPLPPSPLPGHRSLRRLVGRRSENTDSAREEFREKVGQGKGRTASKGGRERRFPSRLIVSENPSSRSFCFRFYFLLSESVGSLVSICTHLDFSNALQLVQIFILSLKREEL